MSRHPHFQENHTFSITWLKNEKLSDFLTLYNSLIICKLQKCYKSSTKKKKKNDSPY